jgi:hypothetical protein
MKLLKEVAWTCLRLFFVMIEVTIIALRLPSIVEDTLVIRFMATIVGTAVVLFVGLPALDIGKYVSGTSEIHTHPSVFESGGGLNDVIDTYGTETRQLRRERRTLRESPGQQRESLFPETGFVKDDGPARAP